MPKNVNSESYFALIKTAVAYYLSGLRMSLVASIVCIKEIKGVKQIRLTYVVSSGTDKNSF